MKKSSLLLFIILFSLCWPCLGGSPKVNEEDSPNYFPDDRIVDEWLERLEFTSQEVEERVRDILKAEQEAEPGATLEIDIRNDDYNHFLALIVTRHEELMTVFERFCGYIDCDGVKAVVSKPDNKLAKEIYDIFFKRTRTYKNSGLSI